jgi:hypothetical protein
VNGASINDTAKLAVNNAGVVNVTGNETVDTLFIDGIQQAAGVYEAAGNPGSNTELAQITGDGTITVVTGPEETYADWIDSFFPGETDPNIIGAAADPDNDGIANVVEMVIGNDPDDGAVENLPTISLVTDPVGVPAGDYLKFSYRRSDASVDAAVTAIAEHDTDLAGAWTTAVPGVDGVVVVETANPGIPGDDIDVYIPRGANEVLFGRLRATLPVD